MIASTTGARVILMRHAKSDYPLGVADHDRPLSARGRSDAAAAGDWLQANRFALLGDDPLILVSSALRTQQTWQIVAAQLSLPATTEPGLYEASEHAYLEILREGLVQASRVLVIGHNPATEIVARWLVPAAASDDYQSMTAKFPTSAIAVIDLPESELVCAGGSLTAFVIPRGESRPAVPE
jgi:phosphohistidine phosphatase